jgi:integrase
MGRFSQMSSSCVLYEHGSASLQFPLLDSERAFVVRLAEGLSLFAGIVPPQRGRCALMWLAVQMIAEGQVTLEDAEALAVELLSLRDSAASTREKYVKETSRFFGFALRCGFEFVDEIDAEVVSDFVSLPSKRGARFAEVRSTTQSNRRAILKTSFGLLVDHGVMIDLGVLGDPIRRDRSNHPRPLTVAELDRLHGFCDGVLRISRVPITIALCEAGGMPLEIARVRVDDIDLDAGTVTLGTTHRRVNDLSDWGLHAIESALPNQNFASGEIYRGSSTDPAKCAQIITTEVSALLRTSRLSADARVKPRSISLGIGAQVMGEHGFLAAAKFLGMTGSLDSLARMFDVDWSVI